VINQSSLKEVLNYDPLTGIFTWKVSGSGRRIGKIAGGIDDGYNKIKVNNKLYKGHRLAWLYVYGTWPMADIDHINGQRADNRIANLRDVSRTHNCQNQYLPHKESSSGVLGVTWHKRMGRFQAGITVDGKRLHLGTFKDSGEAHNAYLKAKQQYHPLAQISLGSRL
jgi:hypothetical protein